MKISASRRALFLAHMFNFLVALYLIIIAIVSLVKLRWYHQLTSAIKVRHFVTSATSYFAFLILIFAGIILIVILIINAIDLNSKTYVSPEQDAINLNPTPQTTSYDTHPENNTSHPISVVDRDRVSARSPIDDHRSLYQEQQQRHFLTPIPRSLVIKDSTRSNPSVCCSILLHLISSISLIIILVVWLLNTGELVKDSISTQLDHAFAKYQLGNKSNHYSVAIDAMQDLNNCCGSLEYSDFPHGRPISLPSGQYPGSCCGKNPYGSQARSVVCLSEEIVRAHQNIGCVTVLANYYDLVSILIVPVALISLFVNITMIAMITISRGHNLKAKKESDFEEHHARQRNSRQFTTRRPASASELAQ